MKRLIAFTCFLAGCVSGPPLPPGIITSNPAKAQAKLATSKVIRASWQPTTRDVYVLGDPLLWGVWNGNSFDLPIDPRWTKLAIPNPTGARLIQLDTTVDMKAWSLIGYFTNFPNGILLIDTSTAKTHKRFYRVGVVVQ